jgi:hypothetical protein
LGTTNNVLFSQARNTVGGVWNIWYYTLHFRKSGKPWVLRGFFCLLACIYLPLLLLFLLSLISGVIEWLALAVLFVFATSVDFGDKAY